MHGRRGIDGKIIKVPPRGPKIDILNAMAALDAVEQMKDPSSVKVAKSITDSIGQIAKNMNKKFDH